MAKLDAIDHIDIVVVNPGEMARFLVSLGFTLVRETDHSGGSIELTFPSDPQRGVVLELVPQVHAEGLRPLGLRHIGLKSDDLEALHRQLKATGYTVDNVRVIEATGRKLFNICGPEGYFLQVVDCK
ncbi:MAG: VOC family protein [Shinella sp.]|uniref:VOC family protein n=1 Tax=Shinella sp. TaxID=1870904 RepID=UPI00403694C5